MLTPLQHNALQRALRRAQNKSLASVPEDQDADSSATQCTATERLNQSAEQEETWHLQDQDADPSAATMHATSAGRQTNWHLCQRIRMPLTHLPGKCNGALDRQQKAWHLPGGSGCCSSATQCTTKSAETSAEQSLACARGSGMLTPLQLHCTNAATGTERTTDMAAVQRIRDADSLCNTMQFATESAEIKPAS
jgi:hypothetical protein